jgi:VanZ family protein
MITDSRRLFEVLAATALAALVLATFLPENWVPRTGLGWEDDHFLMYFATTTLLCIASRRPFVVAVSLIVCAGLLEVLQGLTPDRIPDVRSALAGTAGVISATTLVALVNAAIRKARNATPKLTPTSGPLGKRAEHALDADGNSSSKNRSGRPRRKVAFHKVRGGMCGAERFSGDQIRNCISVSPRSQ